MSIDFKIRDFFHPVAILRLRAFLGRSQWFGAEALVRFQEQRLRRVIEHAYQRVPYYRDLFRRHRLVPADVRTLADLSRLPILSKATLRGEFDRLRAPGHRGQLIRTSGTAGEPVRILLDKPANVLEFAYYWRHWSWAGYRLRHRFAELTSQFFLKRQDLAAQPFYFQRAPNRLLLNSLALSPARVWEYAQAIRAYRPRFLKGIASALYYFALFCREGGITDLALSGIFSTGETLTPHYRRRIEEVFHCKVYDSYGHMERTVAVSECPAGGFHINPEYGILELIDRTPCRAAEGEPANPGRKRFSARIVGTSLHNLVMPLLRYETGDLAEIEEPTTPCPCGRAMPRVHRILGRQGDVIVTPDGRVVTTLFIVFDQVRGIVQGQIVQDAADGLAIRIVPAPEFSAQTEAELIHYVRRFVGPVMRVTVEYLRVDDLRREFPEKFRTVVSRIHPDRAACCEATL